MSDPFDAMLEGYDDVEESSGFDGDPLPTGWYPLKIAKVYETSTTTNGAVRTRCGVSVLEGPHEGKVGFFTLNMSPSRVDKNGAARTQEEIKAAAGSIQAQLKGFLSALGLSTGQPVGEGDRKIANFFNVGSWEGREFIGKMQYVPAKGQWSAQNNLNAYYSMGHDDKGIDWWRSNHAGNSAAPGETATI
jgi:hypothetical protein